jgi:membrane protein YdbS with pleckstrin-like domain
MAEEEVRARPVLARPVVANMTAYPIFLAVVYEALSFLLPSLWVPLFVLAAIFCGVCFCLATASMAFIHFTELYAVGDGYVSISRGLIQKTSAVVPISSIVEARAVFPLLPRLLGVGSVVIMTNDGSKHVLHNIRDARSFVERIADNGI